MVAEVVAVCSGEAHAPRLESPDTVGLAVDPDFDSAAMEIVPTGGDDLADAVSIRMICHGGRTAGYRNDSGRKGR